MIYDRLENASFYYGMGPKFEAAFRFLAETDFSEMPAGVYNAVLNGKDTVYKIKRYDSRPPEDCKLETHNECIDLQYIVSGREYFCYAPLDSDLKEINRHPTDDFIYYEGETSKVVVKTGMFAMAHPGDAHLPELRIESEGTPVVKVVVKVPVD